MSDKTAYRGEFGSSPCMLDDMIADPALMAKMVAEIPNLEDRPADEIRYPGDLCKIGGIIHVWSHDKWMSLEDANAQQFMIGLQGPSS